MTAAFLKELLRKAALLSCEEDEAGEGPIRVRDAHMAAALDQLLDSRNQLTRCSSAVSSQRAPVNGGTTLRRLTGAMRRIRARLTKEIHASRSAAADLSHSLACGYARQRRRPVLAGRHLTWASVQAC